MQTEIIRSEIPRLLSEFEIQSMLDVPCGDFHWMQKIVLPIDRYLGADILPEIISRNQSLFASSQRRFQVLNILRDRIPRVDLILCRDCLVHFSFKDIRKAIRQLKKSEANYLLTTTFPGRDNFDIITGEWRPLDLQRPPFSWPCPIRLINEGCTENKGIYADKSLGLWKLAAVQI